MLNILILLQNGHHFRAMTICRKASKGEPYRFTREFSGTAALTDYCIQGEHAYLFFDGTGVLKVYDLSGKYLHSYAFHTFSGGGSHLNTDMNRVYLEDQIHNMYSFVNGEFERYYERDSENYPDQIDNYQKRISPDGVKYIKKWASIIAVTEDGTQKTIISRPFFHVFFEEKISFAIHALLFIYFFVIGVRAYLKHNAGQ